MSSDFENNGNLHVLAEPWKRLSVRNFSEPQTKGQTAASQFSCPMEVTAGHDTPTPSVYRRGCALGRPWGDAPLVPLPPEETTEARRGHSPTRQPHSVSEKRSEGPTKATNCAFRPSRTRRSGLPTAVTALSWPEGGSAASLDAPSFVMGGHLCASCHQGPGPPVRVRGRDGGASKAGGPTW